MRESLLERPAWTDRGGLLGAEAEAVVDSTVAGCAAPTRLGPIARLGTVGLADVGVRCEEGPAVAE